MAIIRMLKWLGALVLAAWLMAGQEVLAWGPGVHTLTALNLLDAVSGIFPLISRVIQAYPVEYVYGCLAADFFIGKGNRRKKKHPHTWEGGFRFLRETNDERETAYAYGFLSHLAADVVAHNLFLPNMLRWHRPSRRMGHLYWELRADHLVGPYYTKIARAILKTDHPECDQILRTLEGKGRRRVKAKKRLFTQTVRLSDYFCEMHDQWFANGATRQALIHDYSAYMVDLSCKMVLDCMAHPGAALCLSYDPMGVAPPHRSLRRRFFQVRRNARRAHLGVRRWMNPLGR